MGNNLNWTAAFANTFPDKGWRPPSQITTASSTAGPALAGDPDFDGGKLWCVNNAWNGSSMWSEVFDSTSGWQGPNQIPHNDTNSRPALAVFGDALKLYCVYQGTDTLLYLITYDGEQWTAPKGLTGNASSGPALAAFNGKLYCVFAGTETIPYLYCIETSNGQDWGGPYLVGSTNSSSSAPALAVLNGKLYCVYRSSLSNNYLFVTSSSNGQDWTTPAPDQPIPQHTTDAEPALCVLPELNKLLCVYGDGNGGQALWYTMSSSGDRMDWTTAKQVSGVQRTPGRGVGLAVANDIIFCTYCTA